MWANLAREKDSALKPLFKSGYGSIWVLVKIMAPFWIPIIIRHLYLGYPERTIILTTTHIEVLRGNGKENGNYRDYIWVI